VVVGSELLNQYTHLIKEDQLLVIEGRVSHDEFQAETASMRASCTI